MPKAIVLCSGGIDSTVALWWARERYTPIVLSFEIAGRPAGERRALSKIIGRAKVASLTVPVRFLRPRASGYIPSRNLVYHAIAIAIAEDRGAGVVVAGHNRSDAKVFKDARPSFFRRLQKLSNLSNKVSIKLPFMKLTDAEVIALGNRMHVPLQLAWSCYRDGLVPCRRCGACRDRRSAFHSLELEDPAASLGRALQKRSAPGGAENLP